MYRLALLGPVIVGCSGGTPRAAEVRSSPPATSRPSAAPSEPAPDVAAPVVEQAILRRRDAHENGFFGSAIALHGDTMAIGCPLLDDPVGPYEDSGALYVFSRNGPSWVERASVTASKPGSQYNLGTSVS